MDISRTNCLAVDGSETSTNAFDWYVKNYHRPSDSLIILHIHQTPQLPLMEVSSGVFTTTEEHRCRIIDSVKEAEAVVEKFKNLCLEKKIECKEIILEKDFVSLGFMICKFAKKKKATVILMGQRPLGAVPRTSLGSTNDYVIRHSIVPVIVIPPVHCPTLPKKDFFQT